MVSTCRRVMCILSAIAEFVSESAALRPSTSSFSGSRGFLSNLVYVFNPIDHIFGLIVWKARYKPRLSKVENGIINIFRRIAIQRVGEIVEINKAEGQPAAVGNS